MPSCFVRPVFWRPGTGCELMVTPSDGVSCQQLFAELGMTLSFAASDAGSDVSPGW